MYKDTIACVIVHHAIERLKPFGITRRMEEPVAGVHLVNTYNQNLRTCPTVFTREDATDGYRYVVKSLLSEMPTKTFSTAFEAVRYLIDVVRYELTLNLNSGDLTNA